MKTVDELQKKEDEFYSKEAQEQTMLRKKNENICNEIVNNEYPYAPNNNYEINSKISDKRSLLKIKCMKERGSPLF